VASNRVKRGRVYALKRKSDNAIKIGYSEHKPRARIAAQEPDLFYKCLYVGATRAATYLGMTCVEDLPDALQAMASLFTRDWR
jgi:hypothetical protein